MAKLPDEEKITGIKFITGIAQPKTAVKSLAFLPWSLVYLAIGYAIWTAYIKPHTKWAEKSQAQTFIVQPGATMNVKQEQSAPPKKKWWVPEPFVETYSFVQTNDQKGFGIKWGCR